MRVRACHTLISSRQGTAWPGSGYLQRDPLIVDTLLLLRAGEGSGVLLLLALETQGFSQTKCKAYLLIKHSVDDVSTRQVGSGLGRRPRLIAGTSLHVTSKS